MTDKRFPGWRYNPDTLEGRQFDRAEDVPEGWVDTLNTPEDAPASVEEAIAPAKPAATSARAAMTRTEITAALTSGAIQFQKNTSTAALLELLRTNVHAALTAKGVEFDPDTDVRDLLATLTS